MPRFAIGKHFWDHRDLNPDLLVTSFLIRIPDFNHCVSAQSTIHEHLEPAALPDYAIIPLHLCFRNNIVFKPFRDDLIV